LLASIRSDIQDIVEAAGKETPEADISGHALINAVSARWRDLRTMRFQIWGDK
jgi:hypothetical protein